MKSMEKIYQEHANTVYGFLLAKTQNPQIAEELTQETFYQAIKGISRFEGKSSVSTWLCSIAKNQWLQYLKKQRNYDPIEEKINEIILESAEDLVMKKQTSLELMNLISQLDETMREVMYLRITQDLSFRQIGEIVGKNENWARVTYYRGKERVLKEVRKYES